MKSNRTRTTLGNLVREGSADYQTGPFGTMLKASEYSAEGSPLISVGEIREGYFTIYDHTPRICERIKLKLPQFVLEEGDIVFGRKGAINRNAIVTKSQAGWFLGSDGIRLRLTEKHDPAFFSYFLRTAMIGQWLLSNGPGAIMPSLNQKILDRVPLFLPPKSEQQRISGVLSAIDAKIDCNNRLNTELEAMAKALYDYWFVQFDFPITAAMGTPKLAGKPYRASGGKMIYNETLKRKIPAGWEGGNILALSEIGGGATPSKKIADFWGGTIPFFTPTDAKSEPFCLNTEDHITQLGLGNSATRLYPKGTLFITARGSVGKVMITSRAMAMNQSCYALCPRHGVGSAFLYFHTLSLMDYLHAKSSGSVFNSIVTNDINFTPTVVPASQQLTAFNEVAEPMFKSILTHQEQNLQLAELRDWLLPMLMNGQVSVG